MELKIVYLFALIVLTLGCWLTIPVYLGALSPAVLVGVTIVNWLSISALVWAARRLSAIVWICAGLLILVMLSLPASVFVNLIPDQGSDPFEATRAVTLFLILSSALLVAAILLHSGLELYQEWRQVGARKATGEPIQQVHPGKVAAVVLALSAVVLAKALHNLYWLILWDSTGDSLNYLWLIFPTLAVLFCAFILIITLPDRTKLAGGLYLLLIPVLIVISTVAQRVDFRQLTEARAARTNELIENYYARVGRYPQDLRQLVPWYSLSVPGPVILYGQTWCYQGGEDYYSLGFVTRQHWSDPRLTGRVYRSKGELPALGRICDEQIAALVERYTWMSHIEDYQD